MGVDCFGGCSPANGGGTKMMEASQFVAEMASHTEAKTGSSRWVEPPFLGLVPPTIFVPYLMLALQWTVACFPVKP